MNKLATLALSLATFTACAAVEETPDETPAAPRDFKVRIENVAPWTALKSGIQTTKVDGTGGGAGPGGAFEITFTAGRGQKLTFASMLGQSNDWFFTTGEDGISLYNEDGMPVAGDVTNQVRLYDAGTEIDQEPGVGDATGPHQPSPDFGAADPIAYVRRLEAVVPLTDGSSFTLPPIAGMVKATLTPGANRTFTFRLENVSNASTLVTSAGTSGIGMSPIAWATFTKTSPLFVAGSADRGQGIEQIAESGRPQNMGNALRVLTGPSTPVSAGIYAVHRDPEPFYGLGIPDFGMGLERIAEDGNIEPLRDMLAANRASLSLDVTGTYDIPVGESAMGPARQGGAFEFVVRGKPGDHVSFASMFGMSNDWFFATRPAGIALFDEQGEPMRGDVSADIGLFDLGTELDQELAIGLDTGPQQSGPNTGTADPVNHVREVPASQHPFAASTHLRVTLEPM